MSAYIFPTVVSLPLGYDCTVPHPYDQIGRRIGGEGQATEITFTATVMCEGQVVSKRLDRLTYSDGKLVGPIPPPISIPDFADSGREFPGFLELLIESAKREPVFTSKTVLRGYSIYTKPGRKTFLSDNAYKFGAPPVISMIAEFERFVDAYPVIHVDRDRGLGETLILINPYKRPILAEIRTADGRRLPRQRIPAESVRNTDMSELLKSGEDSWAGHIQLTANNRVIAFNIKHAFGNSRNISDHEHLDPYRADPGYEPSTQALRRWVGGKLRRVWQRSD